MAETPISIRGLNHYYGKGEFRTQILCDIDIEIHAGEIVIMTGPSRKPDASIQIVPVISPAPFNTAVPANAGNMIESSPRGRIAVTPVRAALPFS